MKIVFTFVTCGNWWVLFFFSPPLPASHSKVSLNGYREEASVVMGVGCDQGIAYGTARDWNVCVGALVGYQYRGVHLSTFCGIFGTSCGLVMAKCTSHTSTKKGSTGTQWVYSG